MKSDQKKLPAVETTDSSWLHSHWIIFVVAVMIGGAVTFANLGVDWLAHGIIRRLYFSDVLTGAVAALLSGIALLRLQVRRKQLLIRMQIVEDVNHHVRNALTAITLSTALQQDPELDALVRDASERIDWVLSDVLAQSVVPNQTERAKSKWNSGMSLERKKRKRGTS
jgi:hypothetical protein